MKNFACIMNIAVSDSIGETKCHVDGDKLEQMVEKCGLIWDIDSQEL